MVIYTIKSGVVCFKEVAVSSEVLFKLGRFSAFVEEEISSFTISKRPARLKFIFDVKPKAQFHIVFREAELKEHQINSLKELGYFIDDSHRIYFVTEFVKGFVIKAFSQQSVPKLLSLLRSLSHNALIDCVPEDLVKALNVDKFFPANNKRLFEKELYPYQQEGLEWLSFCVSHGLGTILADDMGLGKTAQVIALVCELMESNLNSKVLVVVPNPLLDNWKREFEFFAPSLEPYIHYGKSRHGIASEIEHNSIIITPYTTLASDITMFEDMPFDLTLFDEASMLKNPASNRSIVARRVSSVIKIAMSGTPVENSLLDAWSLTDLVFEGYLGSIDRFKNDYINPDIRETLKGNLEELEQSLKQITLRRMKKDVLGQLPSKQDIHVAVTANSGERKGYEQIIQEMKADMESGGRGMLPLINRLQQYTAHPTLVDSSIPINCASLISSSAKFELLILKLDQIKVAGRKVLIFVTFRKAIDLIEQAIKERYCLTAGVIDGRTPNDKRQLLIDQFSASAGFDVLLLHPKTAGMGLNITAANNVIHYCRQWNPALEEQATARAWRNGQKDTVNVYYMYYADTVEETIDERIRLKQELSDRVVSVTDDKNTDRQIMINYLES